MSQATISNPSSGGTHSPRGSLWNRWDLHFHTPSSFDYANGSVTDQQLVDRLKQEGIRVVAITDHHKMDTGRIRNLQRLGGSQLTILPALELRDDHGGKPIHYICLFSEGCDLDHVWTTLQGRLGLTPADVKTKGGDDKIYVPIKDGAEATRDLGGVVSIHAGDKSNSIEEIKNYEQFQQRLKFDITKKWVDIMEVGQLKDVETYLQIVFPNVGFEKPLIVGSDNHDVSSYVVRAPQWFRTDPTFRGLLMVLREPRDRVFVGTIPPEILRVKLNPTKYIRSIAFSRKANAPAEQTWFQGTVPFSSGLVAIIGNKGSGKSALSDTLGLLGATKNGSAFSFLSKDRFRHPVSGFATSFDAALTWESGQTVTKCLADEIRTEDVERVKYLPQDHVERVCNELATAGGESFERELKSVIFSHVPEADRLGISTLDDLVRFRTGEKQKRIDFLLKQLRNVSRERALLEAQANPIARRELRERIKRRQLELEAHASAKPAEVPDPAKATEAAKPDAETSRLLKEHEDKKKELTKDVGTADLELRTAERRRAVASRLVEKLRNLRKEYDEVARSLDEDAKELGLKPSDLVTLTIEPKPVERELDAASERIKELKLRLDGNDAPGLRSQLEATEKEITRLQLTLDAPNRAYQTYITSLAEWGTRQAVLQGNETESESLNGLTAGLRALDLLPGKIALAEEEQRKLSLEIHAEKLAQVEVFRELYGPVQSFIDSHQLAQEKLRLEFRAELVASGLGDRLLALIAQNRRGSFMGIDEGVARLRTMMEGTRWDDSTSVRKFLDALDEALHRDLRDPAKPDIQLDDQLAKGKTVEEIYNLIYGLEYLRPRYVLKWDDKSLSMLSPGERGTLLLVFYLLIDKSDIPLVIDQPEGNLDNHTVAKVLVDCIKEARSRRQVFIVTHNPNLAVVCDADQVVHAEIDKAKGNAITYQAGSLENPMMAQYVTDVLEGTRWAFGVRGDKYEVALDRV